MSGQGQAISRQRRKIDALRETIDDLHDRIASLKNLKKERENIVRKLRYHNGEMRRFLKAHGICLTCGLTECVCDF